jgi:hypothetical protein
MMQVYYYYRKPNGTLGKLLDDSPEAVEDIDMEINRNKEAVNTTRVLAVIEGSVK